MIDPLLPEFEPIKTLRDEFAMVALNAILSRIDKYEVRNSTETTQLAYVYADLMMEARK